jgi:hypothetical protein
MKRELCRAFCDEIRVAEVPVGLAVSTAFRRADGDAVGFYVVRDVARPGFARLEDDGTTIPYLEACGIDFETQTRANALAEILIEHGAELDTEEAVIHTQSMREDDLPRIAMHFVALLLRMNDFLLLRQEHVESAFKEDAARRIKDAVGTRATVQEGEPVGPRLKEVSPDLVLKASGRDPVAVFLANSSQRVNDAIFLQMAASYEAGQAVSVIALLERESSVSQALRQRAANRLTTVPVFTGDEDAAIKRIHREVFGSEGLMH